jgi:hypothetical protein
MIKKSRVSPIKMVLDYWMLVPNMSKCLVEFTSWITRIAAGLGLLDNAILTYIPAPHRIIGFEFFSHAHLLK